ncbi:MAG: thioredoxin domain-containing protein [Bdellovibrionaceae bacterium]|nr:thioredoxin domain-containing protein [Pseudobdellovibrionaceae bacterium]MBX3034864.1 thioredoxin domain-containing protein [Pseudobdellovibrionaceae bacterium]
MENSRKRFLMLALIFTLIAVGLHFYLAQQHYGLKFGGATGPSVCNINSQFNCDAVAASSYSTVFGVPVAVFGAVANLVLAFLLLVSWLGWTEDREAAARHSLWLAILIFLASVVMGFISFTMMHTYCLFCLAAYVLSILTLLCAWMGAGGLGPFMDDVKALFQERKWILGLFIAVPVLAFVSHVSTTKNLGGANLEPIVRDSLSRWSNAATTAEFDHSRGLEMSNPDGAKMTIVEFADFRCSHCRHAYPTLHAFANAHPDVKFVFKYFPLDGTCNPAPALGGRGDGISCLMASIVQCEQKTRQQGWEAHHYFFDNQESLVRIPAPDEVMKRYCDDQKADCEALKACVESGEIRDLVRASAMEGVTAGVQGTPSVFVNGKNLPNGQLIPVLEGAYRQLTK